LGAAPGSLNLFDEGGEVFPLRLSLRVDRLQDIVRPAELTFPFIVELYFRDGPINNASCANRLGGFHAGNYIVPRRKNRAEKLTELVRGELW